MSAFQVAYDHTPGAVKHVLDWASVGTSITAFAGVLTGVFAALGSIASFAWLCIRIYETSTVQKWLKPRK